MKKIEEFEKSLKLYESYQKISEGVYFEKGFMLSFYDKSDISMMGQFWTELLIDLDAEDIEYFRKKYVNDEYRLKQQKKKINDLEGKLADIKKSAFDMSEDVKKLRIEIFQEKNKLHQLKTQKSNK